VVEVNRVLGQSELMGFIPTADAARAREFYCGVLQLELVEDNGFALILRAPHGSIRIVRAPEFTPFPFTLLGWRVAGIEAEVQALGAVGVTFERYPYFEQDALGIWTAPGGAKVAWFKDPDGNTLSLTQTQA
jgi:catechol 2,3-dioxygenase-like lactoylglutathione lyase family enzyme